MSSPSPSQCHSSPLHCNDACAFACSPHSPRRCKSCNDPVCMATARWRTFAELFPFEPEQACILQQQSTQFKPSQPPFSFFHNKKTSPFVLTALPTHTETFPSQDALKHTICEKSQLSPSFFNPANTVSTMPNHNNPFTCIDNCHITFGNHPMHSNL